MNVILKIFSLIIFLSTLKSSYAQIEIDSFEFEGHTRDYIVFLPQNFQPNMPVVFNLHGYRITAQDQMDNTLMNEVADTMGFLVVYPNAIPPGFNTGLSLPSGWPSLPDVNDVGFISNLIDTIKVKYDIDLNRIYCCGFSNGSFMTIKLACQIGHRFAAGATVAGVMLDTLKVHSDQLGSFPILMCHGTKDLLQPYNGDASLGKWSVEETLNFWIQNNNCLLEADTISLPDIYGADGCTVNKISYIDCSDSTQVVFYKVINGGHNWPSGTFSNPFIGNTNRDININVEIWNFLKEYQINPTSLRSYKNHNIPIDYNLMQNYPNPFNPGTIIKYTIAKSPLLHHGAQGGGDGRGGLVTMKVYDVLGREVTTLINKHQKPGYYEVKWIADDKPSGVYFYQLTSSSFIETKKMLLIK